MSQQWNSNGGQYPPPQQGYYNGPPPGPYNPGPSQPYAPSAPPPQGYNGYSEKPFADPSQRFKSKKKINDLIFLILFVAQFLAALGFSGYVLQNWVKTGGNGGGGIGGKNGTGTMVSLDQHTAWLLLLVTAAGLLLATSYLLAVRAFTRVIMHATLILSIALNIGLCVYYWIIKYYSAAIVFTIIAIFSVLSYWGYKSRIPLASLLLQIVIDIANHHTSVYAVAFAALFLQGALSVWFIFSTLAVYGKYTPGSTSCAQANVTCSSGKVAGLVFFLTFSYIWTSFVVGNMALATLAGGPFGGWYYFGPASSGNGYATGMPKNPTLKSLGRAFKSLGSIAFGSLIVTLLELLRLLLDSLRQGANSNGDAIGAILACVAECLVGCVESMVEYFNRYAYIEIALYGHSYITAAKKTWRLFKDRGIDALVNDSLVNMTLMWGAYIVGALSALFAYLYLRYTKPAYNANNDYTSVVVFFAFIIGAQCSLTMTSALEAGVSTIFVGLAEDPQVLAIRAPELFQTIESTYPQVVQGVNDQPRYNGV